VGTAIEHPVPDRVKPSFVIFDIQALRRSGLSVRMPKLTNDVTGLAQDALYLYPNDNSGCQRVKLSGRPATAGAAEGRGTVFEMIPGSKPEVNCDNTTTRRC